MSENDIILLYSGTQRKSNVPQVMSEMFSRRSFMNFQNKKVEIIKRISVIFPLVFFASCNSLPEGDPPPPDQPIIVDPPPVIEKQPLDPASKVPPIIKPREINGHDAVNYMLTSLATRCRPIASPGKEIPEILNRFTVAHGDVNDLPMEVWQRLIRNKMIKPISNPKERYAYSLVSEIETLSTPIAEKQKYLWKMHLIQNTPAKKVIWKANFKFAQE